MLRVHGQGPFFYHEKECAIVGKTEKKVEGIDRQVMSSENENIVRSLLPDDYVLRLHPSRLPHTRRKRKRRSVDAALATACRASSKRKRKRAAYVRRPEWRRRARRVRGRRRAEGESARGR